MNPRFTPGVLVEVLPISKSNQVGMRFHVTRHRIMSMDRGVDGKLFRRQPCYIAPWGNSKCDKQYYPEECLREVDIDDGFEFKEEWVLWSPGTPQLMGF